VKLFKKPKSKFYWYDFTVRGRRYRGSTQETKSVRALQIASLKLASVMERTDPLPTKPAVLQEFADRFLDWVNDSRLEEKTRKFYRNGWRLLKCTSVAMLRVDQITTDSAEQLKFPGSAANANCALRTLRRMLHKAEEWKVIGHAPKIKMMKEHGRHLRLDDEAERKLITGALACNWRPRTRELFRDIVILMRDTGMRNERELFRMRIENLDWQNRVIFVPDSKTAEGRRLVPMSGRVFAILRDRCDARQEGWVFPSKRSASGHLANGENPQIVRAMLRWTKLNMLAHYAHGFKSDKLEAQGAVLDKLVKSGVKSGVGNDWPETTRTGNVCIMMNLPHARGRLTQR